MTINPKLRYSAASTILLLALACIEGQQEGSPQNLRHTTLRLRWLVQSQFAGVFWADENRIFAENGLDVSIEPGGPGINLLQAVGSGSEDFGIAGAAQIIEARDRGMPIRSLAVIFQDNPNVFFARKESGISRAKDWVGRTVAVKYGYDLEYIYRAILKREGIDSKMITEYPAKFDMTPFFRGEVDVWAGYAINEPNTAEEMGFEVNRISPAEYGIHLSGDTLIATEETIARRPEVVQRMVFSVLEGWHRALRDPSRAVEMMLRLDPRLSREHERKMIESVDGLTRTSVIAGKIGWMTEIQWEQMLEIWKEFGGLKTDIRAADCFDNSFVEAYYAGPGKRWLAKADQNQ